MRFFHTSATFATYRSFRRVFLITIQRRGIDVSGTVEALFKYRPCTIQVMTQRPVVEDETIEELDSALQDVMAVEPESVGLDKKINVLLDEYQTLRFEASNTLRGNKDPEDVM